MSRDVSATNATAAAADTVFGEYLIDLEFPSGTLRTTTASRTVTVGANTYQPDGKIVSIDAIPETSDITSRGMTLQLSGIDADLVTAIMTDDWHNTKVTISVCFFDADWQKLDDPVPIAPTLYMSDATITLGKNSGELSINCELAEVFYQRNSSQLATSESQKRRYSGDTGLDYLADLGQREVDWGGVKRKLGGGGGHGGAGTPINSGSAPSRAAETGGIYDNFT